jgi:hypothetical protein
VDGIGLLFIGLALVDLGQVDRRMVHPEHTWPGLSSRVGAASQQEIRENGLTRFLQARSAEVSAPVRILPLGRLFDDNSWMAHDVASVGGYHPAKPLRIQRLLEQGNLLTTPAVLNMLCVRYIVSPEPLEGGGSVAYPGPEAWAYANPGALPRAWISGRWRRVEGGACLQALGGLEPRDEVLLEEDPEGELDADAVGTATIERFQANRVELQVESSGAALLVLSEAYHPHWQAEVNGARSPVLAANCLLRAVPIPAGTSKVVFYFVDPAMRAGLRGSTVGLLGVLLLLLIDAVRWRRRVGGAAGAGEGA